MYESCVTAKDFKINFSSKVNVCHSYASFKRQNIISTEKILRLTSSKIRMLL